MTFLLGKRLSFDAGNDMKIRAKLITMDYESLVREKIEKNSFSLTMHINMIGTQSIYAKDNIKVL